MEEKINTGPGFIKVEVEDTVIDKITMVLETDCTVETSTKATTGEEEITVTEVVIESIGPITEITVGPEIVAVTEMVTGIPIDQITKGKIVVKGKVIETMIAVDLGIEIEIGGIGVAPDKAPTPEAVPKTDTRTEGRVGMIPEIETGPNLDLDPLLV